VFIACAIADFPIRNSSSKEWLPAVDYNSADHEYLVVWSEGMFPGLPGFNGVRGQRVAEDGNMVGSSFLGTGGRVS
jgi:hypothetical protein